MSQSSVVLRGGTVLTVDAQRSVLEGHDVLVVAGGLVYDRVGRVGREGEVCEHD